MKYGIRTKENVNAMGTTVFLCSFEIDYKDSPSTIWSFKDGITFKNLQLAKATLEMIQSQGAEIYKKGEKR